MLRLREHVGRDRFGSRIGVGDHEEFRGAGGSFAAHRAEEDALRGGDIAAARSHDDVSRLDGAAAEGQGGYRLGSPRGEKAVGAREGRGGQRDAGRSRSGAPHRTDARGPGRQHGHEGAGGQRVESARNIAPCAVHRQEAVPGDAALQGQLEVRETGALGRREGRDAVAAPLEEAALFPAESAQRAFQRGSVEKEPSARLELAEPLRPAAERGLSLVFDFVDYGGGRPLGLAVARARGRGVYLGQRKTPQCKPVHARSSPSCL